MVARKHSANRPKPEMLDPPGSKVVGEAKEVARVVPADVTPPASVNASAGVADVEPLAPAAVAAATAEVE